MTLIKPNHLLLIALITTVITFKVGVIDSYANAKMMQVTSVSK